MGSKQNFKKQMSITSDSDINVKGPQKNLFVLSEVCLYSLSLNRYLNSSLLTFYEWFMKKSLLQYVAPSTLFDK